MTISMHFWLMTAFLLTALVGVVDGLTLNRRSILLGSASAILPSIHPSLVQEANAIPLPFEKKDRRQLELCLVNVLRVQYWAMKVADILKNAPTDDQKKKAYLEVRLGAKAMVADKKIKIGGGSLLSVITLRGLQIKDCLDDLKYYAKNKKMDQYRDDLIESLASLVEFDGLETTQDPSPRSTLTLGMYNESKNIYVQRMLTERIIPLTDQTVNYFGKDQRIKCEGYVEQFYPRELPAKKIIQEQVKPTEGEEINKQVEQ
ncbi:unnamed protein product [Cylindrotheca closterium]|uniref:Uncharacterized protein n=1 Tax=Cylindrotheca closterium TaxID=2856 RepID=A0AAD2CXC8_9STRA|nr:unnamed protein product [Cylindrotheca closterium]